jgi:hypothetical protein
VQRGHSSIVRVIDVGPGVQQTLDRRALARVDCHHQRGAPAVAADSGVSSVLQQQLDGLDLVELGGEVDGLFAVFVWCRRPGWNLSQHLPQSLDIATGDNLSD